MSKKKYVIESAFENVSVQKIMQLGLDANGRIINWTDSIEDVEELNSDYINEHYGELQDEAYLKGFKDGKNSFNKGCEGCRYTSKKSHEDPCFSCTRNHMDQYEPMPQEDDRIEVGDVVERYVDGKLDSKGIYLQEDSGYWRCLFDTNGVLMTFAYPKGQFKKTGKHYDIASILEAMRNDR